MFWFKWATRTSGGRLHLGGKSATRHPFTSFKSALQRNTVPESPLGVKVKAHATNIEHEPFPASDLKLHKLEQQKPLDSPASSKTQDVNKKAVKSTDRAKRPLSSETESDPLGQERKQTQKPSKLITLQEPIRSAVNETLKRGTNPAFMFPGARQMKRKIILHIGPTNSGKTYTALQAFQKAESGYYAGPLRLLAREVYNRMKSQGRPCNLVTGDEIITEYDELGNEVRLSSGTVEMISLSQVMDIAVIDEIQMLSDRERGWAWTQAVLAVRAREVHLCGDPNVESVIRQLVDLTGDSLEVCRYERLGPLKVKSLEKDAIPILKRSKGTSGKAKDVNWDLEKGDCLVYFSKKAILEAKQSIEQNTNFKCAVIYGSLPAETRVVQAQKFNDPNDPHQILIASDAIGMGLNLAVRRIIFSSLQKFDGREIIKIPVAQVKQVAGRAGRYKVAPVHGSEDPTEKVEPSETEGLVTAFKQSDLKYIDKCLQSQSEPINKVYFYPPDWLIRDFGYLIGNLAPFDRILLELERRLKLTAPFKFTDLSALARVASYFRPCTQLTLDDKITLAKAPVAMDEEVSYAFFQFCRAVASGNPHFFIDFDIDFSFLRMSVVPDLLTKAEKLHRILNLYLWLSYRFPTIFLGRENAMDLRTLCQSRIDFEISTAERSKPSKSHHVKRQDSGPKRRTSLFAV